MSVGKQFDEENGYDSSREIAFYMQQVAKEAGVTEEELAEQILAEAEAEEDAEDADDSEALQSIGLWDRFKSAVKKPFNSMSDWADNHDAQWKTAMVQAMFGDTAPMNSYYQQQKQMEEAQKNREFQAEQARLNREAQQNYNEILAGKESDTEAKERQRQLAAVELGDELKDKIESGEITRDEAQVKAHAAFREGKLTYQELKDIRGIIEGKTKTEIAEEKLQGKEEARKDKFQGAADARTIKKADEAADERDTNVKLAKAGRAAIKAGRRPTRQQQAAIDDGY